MAHVIGYKVCQAYDRSEFLDERRTFMVSWCDALLAQGLKVWWCLGLLGSTLVPIFLGFTWVAKIAWNWLRALGSEGLFNAAWEVRYKCHRSPWGRPGRPYTTYIETGWIEQPPLQDQLNNFRSISIFTIRQPLPGHQTRKFENIPSLSIFELSNVKLLSVYSLSPS